MLSNSWKKLLNVDTIKSFLSVNQMNFVFEAGIGLRRSN